jgi:hypothetical protein
MVPKAHRWVGEMAEIAKTFEACGLTPRTFQGAADLYAQVAASDLGRMSPEDWSRHGEPFETVVSELARSGSKVH